MEHKCEENDTAGLATTTIKKGSGTWYADICCGDADLEISYCPFCGTKLE